MTPPIGKAPARRARHLAAGAAFPNCTPCWRTAKISRKGVIGGSEPRKTRFRGSNGTRLLVGGALGAWRVSQVGRLRPLRGPQERCYPFSAYLGCTPLGVDRRRVARPGGEKPPGR